MPDASSPDRPHVPGEPGKAEPAREAVMPSPATRALMVAMGFLPLLHVIAVVAAAVWGPAGPVFRTALALAVLYLLPPLFARMGAWVMPLPEGEVTLDDRRFLGWWLSAQWQVVFNRLRFLEEALRLLPGAYSWWLRLWGARVGALVYWSPGFEPLDRGLLEVGDRVVFGAGVRLAGHVLLPGRDGATRLLVAPVRIGHGALVGAYSVLTPGTSVSDGAVSPPLRVLRSLKTDGRP